jgi:hypothetical protein
MFLMVIFGLGVLILGVIQVPEYFYLQKLRREGLRAAGTITQIESHGARGAGASIMFSYEANRVPHEAFQEISQAHYQRLEGESQVNLAYLPGREGSARLADQDEDWTGFNKNLRLTALFAFGTLFFFLMTLAGKA